MKSRIAAVSASVTALTLAAVPAFAASTLPAITFDLTDMYTVAGVILTAMAAIFVVKKVIGLLGK
jgi:hypothetical protein